MAKEESPPFLARRMPFCPGMGRFGNKKLFRIAESSENTFFSEIKPLFFSTQSEMIQKSLFPLSHLRRVVPPEVITFNRVINLTRMIHLDQRRDPDFIVLVHEAVGRHDQAN